MVQAVKIHRFFKKFLYSENFIINVHIMLPDSLFHLE